MDFRKITSTLAPMIAVGMAAALSGCHNGEISLHGAGKPLAELDLSGPAPSGVVVLGPDAVRIEPGEKLAIKVEGDPAQANHLRFTLKDGTLGVMRDTKGWDNTGGAVSVLVTMPAPKSLTMTGSGRITAAELAREAQINIVGSGDIDTPKVEGDKLDVSIGGSGTYRGAGHTADLKVNIAGSGSAEMAPLKADKADISILGSGGAQLASDGTVKASMMGSGSVHVKGRAKCEVSAMGSGKLVCEP